MMNPMLLQISEMSVLMRRICNAKSRRTKKFFPVKDVGRPMREVWLGTKMIVTMRCTFPLHRSTAAQLRLMMQTYSTISSDFFSFDFRHGCFKLFFFFFVCLMLPEWCNLGLFWLISGMIWVYLRGLSVFFFVYWC